MNRLEQIVLFGARGVPGGEGRAADPPGAREHEKTYTHPELRSDPGKGGAGAGVAPGAAGTRRRHQYGHPSAAVGAQEHEQERATASDEELRGDAIEDCE